MALPFDPEQVATAAKLIAEKKPVKLINGHDDEALEQIVPPEFAEDSLGLIFSGQYADTLRFVAAWNRWMVWDGVRWKHDSTLRVYDLVRKVCRAISAIAPKPPVQTMLASAKTIASVERLVRSDRRHAATVEQWDNDPWLLNTPGGIIDLRSGTISPHDPDAHMTRCAAVAPDGSCPMWLGFLKRVTADNDQLMLYLQRVAGYCLTGLTKEHAMFFAYGTGRNGKGVFLNTLASIMGDYARISPVGTFTAATYDRHDAELAFLQGSRLVTAQETEEGRQWAEARIKSLTGGDPITAHFMRQDYFTFTPQFKLFIAGNHKPGLRNVDEAIMARLNLVPFDVTIPEGERDMELPQKLRSEWPGILRWMIEGCLRWQRNGLDAPATVRVASTAYFDSEDALGQWMADECKVDKSRWTSSGHLFACWKSWADKTGEVVGSQKRFSQALADRGFSMEKKTGGVRGFNGIGLLNWGA